jgi:hypothetical protein
MDSLIIKSTPFSPEIILDHDNKTFGIKGNSRPEDVRDIYFPVVEWIHDYRVLLKNIDNQYYSEDDPLIFEFDLEYFNSSSAKFLYDIVEGLKQIKEDGVSVGIAWLYDNEDTDMKEAGEDLSYLAEFDFAFIAR